ncbi:methylthioribose kinase [Bacillus salacetis]|uniref:Methylthioribose kinase n=1 Tax=Bacillus salacetis TaxID=2315464 RepID=A0A3A1QM12_9BACI|nr:methylthioribose kinase [Bacillus salacetis]RIW27448.1 methylthioribose kinase [Bacillus salacetis]
MIQRFIELGEGYSDLYELIELAHYNEQRIQHFLAFHTVVNDRPVTSLAVVLKPAREKFQPLYICREGIPDPNHVPNKRFELFEQAAKAQGREVIQMDVKPSSFFAEKDLYYQHLIAILRLNHYIPPMQ